MKWDTNLSKFEEKSLEEDYYSSTSEPEDRPSMIFFIYFY